MKKLNKISIMSITTTVGAILNAFILSPIAYGITQVQSGANSVRASGQPDDLFGATGALSTISNTMLYVVGALSVLMLVIGGFRYVVSGGNDKAVTAAKNTVLYAIVGLVIALMSYAAINFVLASLVNGGATGGTNL